MARSILIAMIAGAMLAVLPAHAQDGQPELEGAPPPLNVPKAPPPKPAAPQAAPKVAPKVTPKPQPAAKPADTSALTAEQARLARQAEAQKAEQARLAALADDLDSRKARLDAKAAELTAEEQRLARVRTDQETDYAGKLAELDRQRTRPPETASLPDASPEPGRARRDATRSFPFGSDELPRVRIRYDDARRACTRAGMSEAMDNAFYSARYESAPHYFERERELRGLMRLDDRRGYLLVDTVCQLDDNGAVLRFDLLR